MPKSPQLKERFRQAVQGYCADQGLTPEAFAGLVGVPRSTGYKWHRGVATPGKKKLQALCRKLGWNYEQFFVRDAIVDEIIRRNFLSFEALQVRYRQVRQRDHIEALAILPVIAALAYNYYVISGVACMLTVDAAFNPAISFGDVRNGSDKLNGFHLVISGKEGEGISFRIVDLKGRPVTAHYALTASNLEEAHQHLLKQ